MESLIVRMKDSNTSQQRFEFLLELLRALPDVEVEVRQVPTAPVAPTSMSEAARASAEVDFWAMAGMWKDRDLDLAKMRQDSFDRRTKNYDR